MQFIWYPRCTTCQRAKKFLDENAVKYEVRDIVKQPLNKDELRDVAKKGGLEIKKMFNTSGIKYREMSLKDKLKDMNDDEKYALLASDGMLVKRPVLIGDDFAAVGFKEDKYKELLNL